MSLTLGSIAPLGRPTGGQLNITVPDKPAHLLFVHELAPRIRGVVDDVTVVDSTGAFMLHETGLLPRWYLPAADVRTDLLESSSTSTLCPFKGDARYWHLRVGDRVIENAFWEYPNALEGAPNLSGLLAPYVEKWGRWWVEDEEMLGHPRDPFHRVDVFRSSRKVTVTVGGELAAKTDRALAVFETGLPTRWYVPKDDVTATLVKTDTSTICPYKGTASYWSIDVGDRRYEDVVWAYETPRDEVGVLAGTVSFLGEGVEVTTDPA